MIVGKLWGIASNACRPLRAEEVSLTHIEKICASWQKKHPEYPSVLSETDLSRLVDQLTPQACWWLPMLEAEKDDGASLLHFYMSAMIVNLALPSPPPPLPSPLTHMRPHAIPPTTPVPPPINATAHLPLPVVLPLPPLPPPPTHPPSPSAHPLSLLETPPPSPPTAGSPRRSEHSNKGKASLHADADMDVDTQPDNNQHRGVKRPATISHQVEVHSDEDDEMADETTPRKGGNTSMRRASRKVLISSPDAPPRQRRRVAGAEEGDESMELSFKGVETLAEREESQGAAIKQWVGTGKVCTTLI